MNLQPPAILNMGAPGSGKTHALSTLLQCELRVFVICTEPDGMSSLLDACEARRIPIDNLHWVIRPPAVPGWASMKEMATVVGTMGYEDITKIKSGVGKNLTRVAAMNLLLACEKFVCERTGRDFGDITQLNDDCAVVLDSLSGLNDISMMAAQGLKPAAHQGEWGVAMNFIEKLILKLTADRRAFFILNAHVEKETNEISGASQIMASTLGRKVAPKLPRFFSEVVYSKRTVRDDQPTFTWSTADPNADLKNRTLPVATHLLQDYRPVVEGYRKRRALAATASPPAAQPTASASAMPTAQVAPMSPSKAAH